MWQQVGSATVTEYHRVGITLCYNVSQKVAQQVAVVLCCHYPNESHIRGDSSEWDHLIWSVHTLQKVYKARGFHYYPPVSVSQDCLCPHPISLICSSLSYFSLLLISSTLLSVSSHLSSVIFACDLLSLSLCSLVLLFQTEILSAELKHYSF